MELSKTIVGDLFVTLGAFLNFITPTLVVILRNKFRVYDIALFDAFLVLFGSYYYSDTIFHFIYNSFFFIILGIFAHVIFGVNTGLNNKLNLNRREYSSTNPSFSEVEYPSWKRYNE